MTSNLEYFGIITGTIRRIDFTRNSAMGNTKYNAVQGHVQEGLSNGRSDMQPCAMGGFPIGIGVGLQSGGRLGWNGLGWYGLGRVQNI